MAESLAVERERFQLSAPSESGNRTTVRKIEATCCLYFSLFLIIVLVAINLALTLIIVGSFLRLNET